MNIITWFNKFLEENFNNYLKKYYNDLNYNNKISSFSNYYNFMHDLDNFSDSFMKNIIKNYFEYIDECFFNSYYRKKFCISNGFYERKNFVTLFGEISFKRRYYFDTKTKEWFFFTDLFLGLPKRKHFDPFVCAEICAESSNTSYSKAGKIISNKIGKRTSNNIDISRATSRNIVLSFNAYENEEENNKRIERLFVMLDEKFVGSQFNDGKDFMIKASIVFEGTEKEYKTIGTKRIEKAKRIDRYRLISPHVCASIDNNLLNDTVNYIYKTYDVDYIKEIVFMGDCATWIKNFPKSYWFNFNPKTTVKFVMDGFHFSQALNVLTTKKYEEVRAALNDYVKENNKTDFERLCNEFIELNPHRIETIESKRDYILNNWNERQLYQNNSYMKCSMESHISHIFADLFTARPRAYSKNGLRKLLKLRLLKVNGIDIKELYLKQLLNKDNKPTNIYKDSNVQQKNKYNKYDIVFPILTKSTRFLYN